ncbi:MAG TPA: hypothetical protein H9915_02245 [Candidatus Gemmiger faecigallinarum]|nr:hypothetical protein [Candidatus Gemmiger faecigallinarum]
MQRSQDPHRYDDLIDLPHPVSARRPRMPVSERAAQFSPFAALTGYGDAIAETARLTDARLELDEETQRLLNRRVALLRQAAPDRPLVRVTCFEPDAAKDGGRYVTLEVRVRGVDLAGGRLLLEGGGRLPLADVIALEGDCFSGTEPDDAE